MTGREAESATTPRSGGGPGAGEVFRVALRLGLTSFGGPIAHLGHFRAEYVDRRRWLEDATYAELVALVQLLPGPSSSQLGMAVGHLRAGLPGALAAWLGFTLPSALAMAVCGAFAAGGLSGAPWVHALQLVAVAVVLDAVLGMAQRLTRTVPTAAVAISTGVALLVLPTSAVTQIGCLIAAGLVGLLLFRSAPRVPTAPVGQLALRIDRRVGVAFLVAFAGLLALLPTVAGLGRLAALGDAMFRSGALVFGGGHVVLPLMQAQTVPQLVGAPDFLTGYGVAQAVPGPLFTIATYVGQVAAGAPGAAVATIAVFLPGFLVLFGVLPFWQRVRADRRVRAALVAVNAAVVGLLGAALIDPIVSSSVRRLGDGLFALTLFLLVRLAHTPAWAVVLLAVLASPVLAVGG